MKYQNSGSEDIPEENLVISEAGEHDEIYKDSYPFWGDSLKIDIKRVETLHDKCYKPNTYLRGRRQKRMLELLDVDNIAGKNILDVGFGNGQYSVYLAMHGANVSGFEISREGVRRAERIAAANDVTDQCEFIIASASDIPYQSKQFDIVLCSMVLHHIWKYKNAIDELYRVLVPGGRLIFAESLRSNPVYQSARDIYRKLMNKTQELGDVDLEYDDLVEYGSRFSETHMEHYTLFSGVKNLLGSEINNPGHLRALFYVLMTLDSKLEEFEMMNKYCLEIVGEFKK